MTAMPAILWHEAEGFCVRDPYGNQWIDLTSGIVMANVGPRPSAHCGSHPSGGRWKTVRQLRVSHGNPRRLARQAGRAGPV